MRARWVWDVAPEDAFASLFDAYTQAVRRAVSIVFQKRAANIETWMKENAIWDDQTGNARQTLWAEFFAEVESMVIEFGHGMDYGFWLEVANAGRFSVILPAIDFWFPVIMQDLQELMGR